MMKTYLEPELEIQLFCAVDSVLSSTFSDSDAVNIDAEDFL